MVPSEFFSLSLWRASKGDLMSVPARRIPVAPLAYAPTVGVGPKPNRDMKTRHNQYESRTRVMFLVSRFSNGVDVCR